MLVLVAPGEEPADRPVIGHAGVLVADGGGEEFEEAARGLVAGVGDHARHHDAVAGGDGQGPGRRYGDVILNISWRRILNNKWRSLCSRGVHYAGSRDRCLRSSSALPTAR